MTSDDARPFLERLVILGELFDAALSEAKQELYFRALQDVPYGDVIAALNAAAKTCTFMPKPAELRKLAVGDAEDLAEQAWMLFRSAMRSVGAYASLATTDPALGEAIVSVFGGWPDACRADLSPEMWAAKRKEFGRVYRVLRDRGLVGPRYLFGTCEQSNQGRDDWQRYVAVGVIDANTVKTIRASEADAYRAQLGAVANELKRLTDGVTLPIRRMESA